MDDEISRRVNIWFLLWDTLEILIPVHRNKPEYYKPNGHFRKLLIFLAPKSIVNDTDTLKYPQIYA